MSNVKGVRCNACGTQAEGPFEYSNPAGWYTLYKTNEVRFLPDNEGPFHFCKPACLAKWLELPVNLPMPRWQRRFWRKAS